MSIDDFTTDFITVIYGILMLVAWLYGHFIFTKGNVFGALTWWILFGLFITSGAYYHLKWTQGINK